jgi:serine/threonine protein kinase
MMESERMLSLYAGGIFADDFKVVRRLSEGGMGAVYVVEQLSTGRQRALKLMLPQLVSDPRLRARFEQEARIGSKIESDHVIEVVGAGVDRSSGVPWLAMELLRGEDLASLVQRVGALPVPAARQILEQLCHAVGAAHAAGIVHRDLKPENVFIAEAKRTGSKFMVKVLDFGIAKVVAEAKTTQTAAVGSPMWMAPEQTARGGVIGPQTDVWAIGLIAFHLLTGRFYWRSAEEETATVAQLLREIVMDPMPSASGRAKEVGEVVLPLGFDAWFERSTDRSPRQRFANASEQFDALGALFNSATTMDAPSHVQASPTFLQAPLQATPLAPTVSDPELRDLSPIPNRGQRAGVSTTVPVSGDDLPVAMSPSHSRRWAVPLMVASAAAIIGLVTYVALRTPLPTVAATPPSSEKASTSSLVVLDAGPTPTTSAAASDNFAPTVGAKVIIRRGPLAFQRGTVGALKGGRALIADDEYSTSDLSFGETPAGHDWQVGEPVLVMLQSQILAGTVSHVRLDNQLQVEVMQGKGKTPLLFSPPSAFKPGQQRLDQVVSIRSSWTAQMRTDMAAREDSQAREAQREHDDLENRRVAAEEERKRQQAATTVAEQQREVKRKACVENCNNSFAIANESNNAYVLCVTQCQ